MAFIPVPQTVMAELFFTYHGQQIENTLYFRRDTGWADSDAEELLGTLFEWWDTEIAPSVVDDLALVRGKVTDLADANSFAIELTPSSAIAGDLTGEGLPANVALCISFRTPARGRSYRGRNYVAGISEGDSLNSQVINGIGEALRAGYADIVNYISTTTADHVVVSRFTSGQPRTVGVATQVTSYVLVDTVFDSQRRRLPGRGA